MSKKKINSKGFTLIEILVVIVIIMVMSAVGFKSFTRSENLKTTIRKLSNTLRDIRTYAKLQNKTFRLVIDMTDPEKHAFWVESSTKQDILAPNKELKEKLERMSADERAEYEANEGFSLDKSILPDPKQLYSGWYFTYVEVDSLESPIKEGKAYIYFLSQGISQEAVIQISNKQKTTWTLHILPVAGGAELYTEAKTLKDLTIE